MTESAKKRLAILEKLTAPKSIMVSVEMPDGRIVQKNAYEWWENRKLWPLASWSKQTKEAGAVACLVLAAMADEAAYKAEDQEEVKRLEDERTFMLKMYFGEGAEP